MKRGNISREGLEVGLIGATAVAVWFFVVDLVAGHPFYTPYTLGSVLQGFFGATATASMPLTVLMYTLFHYLAFIGIGIVAAAIFNAADRAPSVLIGFGILFVALETVTVGLTALVEESSPLRTLAWYQVAAANLVASLAMGIYLVRRHRSAVSRAALSLGGI